MADFSFSYRTLTQLKNSFREDTWFLKRFPFCISFNNFLTDICVDQVFLKNLGSQSGKKFVILNSNFHVAQNSSSSIRISMLHKSVPFIILFSVPKPKSDLSDKIYIENQLANKTIQLRDL